MNKSYIFNDKSLIKMKNDKFCKFCKTKIDFSFEEIEPFLVCCSIKNNNNIKQDKIVIPINDN